MTVRNRSRALALAIAAATAGGAAVLGLPALAAAADAPSAALPITGGTFDWGVKQSFRSYVTGAAAGTVSTAAGAGVNTDDTFHFTGGTGSYDTATHAVTVGFKGSVEFTSTLHGFDITLADLKVTTAGTAGMLSVDVTAGGSTAQDVDFAALDLSKVRPGGGADGAMSFDGIPATLTADGAKAFNGMYQAGTALDPADLSVIAAAPPTTPPVTTPATPVTTPPTTAAPTTGTPTTAAPTTAPTKAPTKAPTSAPGVPVVDGNLDWGVKESFRSYVTGPIAAGKVELTDGAAESGGGYRFPDAAGRWAADTDSLTAAFSGGVEFLGHLQQGAYALDLKFTDLKVATKGTTGTLTADVSSKDVTTGKVSEYDDLAVAALTGVAPEAAGAVVTVKAAKAALTADGAKVFSGFYEAGAALDPVTVTVSLDAAAPLPSTTPAPAVVPAVVPADVAAPVGGTGTADTSSPPTLAATGSDTPSTPLLAAAAALIATGAAATIAVSRRRNS